MRLYMSDKKSWLLLILTVLLSVNTTFAAEVIPPTHSAIRYIGRVDKKDPQVFLFDWPGVSIDCIFTGEVIGVRIEGGEKNYFNIFIDGKPVSIVNAPRDTILYFRT